MEFITNQNSRSHFGLLKQLLDRADSLYVMVAFLRNSGLDKLIPYFDELKETKIIAGTNFGITDPDALTKLYEISLANSRVLGYINKMDSRQTFHPKMYLIKHGQKGHIIVGSSNLTDGGLIKNLECSLYQV